MTQEGGDWWRSEGNILNGCVEAHIQHAAKLCTYITKVLILTICRFNCHAVDTGPMGRWQPTLDMQPLQILSMACYVTYHDCRLCLHYHNSRYLVWYNRCLYQVAEPSNRWIDVLCTLFNMQKCTWHAFLISYAKQSNHVNRDLNTWLAITIHLQLQQWSCEQLQAVKSHLPGSQLARMPNLKKIETQ